MQPNVAYLCAGLVLVALVGCSLADNVENKKYSDKANPGKCTVPAPDNVILAPGEVGNLKSICAQVKCLNADGDATLEQCDKYRYQIPQDCGGSYPQLKNPKDPYPDCCQPEINCRQLWFKPEPYQIAE